MIAAQELRGRRFGDALAQLRTARSTGTPPEPEEFAEILRTLAEADQGAMRSRWAAVAQQPMPSLHSQRAQWAAALSASERLDLPRLFEEDAIWREMAQWRRSARQYAASLALWGRAAVTAGTPAWPPAEHSLAAFSSYFRNGDSLDRYLSHVRSCLR